MASSGNNARIFPFDGQVSVFVQRKDLSNDLRHIRSRDGIRHFTSEYCLSKMSQAQLDADPVSVGVLLRKSSVDDLSSCLLEFGNAEAARRVAGLFRSVGDVISERRLSDVVRSIEPGHYPKTGSVPPAMFPAVSAEGLIATRLRAIWGQFREQVAVLSPPAAVNAVDVSLSQMDDLYLSDAYNSLSIEGYQVTEDLIRRVASGDWGLDRSRAEKDVDALAARGYRNAFLDVRSGIESVLSGEKSIDDLLVNGYREWRTALFLPAAQAGIIRPHEIVGFRRHAVYLQGSRHVPVAYESLLDAIETFEDLVRSESDPFVKAVLGHFMLGFIHPFPDGNGRTARFFMNAALVSGGHPWVVVPVSRRAEYLKALESASVDQDIRPFAEFIRDLVLASTPALTPASAPSPFR